MWPSIPPCISTSLLQNLPFKQNTFQNIYMDKRPWEKDPVRKAKIPLRRDMVVPIIPQDVLSYGCHHMLFLTHQNPRVWNIT